MREFTLTFAWSGHPRPELMRTEFSGPDLFDVRTAQRKQIVATRKSVGLSRRGAPSSLALLTIRARVAHLNGTGSAEISGDYARPLFRLIQDKGETGLRDDVFGFDKSANPHFYRLLKILGSKQTPVVILSDGELNPADVRVLCDDVDLSHNAAGLSLLASAIEQLHFVSDDAESASTSMHLAARWSGLRESWHSSTIAASTEIQASDGMRSQTSPFIVGRPIVHPHDFYGRSYEAHVILRGWSENPLHNVAILGPRGAGKTSLLNYVMHLSRTPEPSIKQRRFKFANSSDYRHSVVNLRAPHLTGRSAVLADILQNFGLPIPDPLGLNEFMMSVRRARAWKFLLFFDGFEGIGKRLPELNDEFWDVFPLLQQDGRGSNFAYGIAARGEPAQSAGAEGLTSSFFSTIGSAVTLGPLTESEARQLIAASPIKFPEADVEWILQHSGRWPALLQILCSRRLFALELDPENDSTWRTDGLAQLERFPTLVRAPRPHAQEEP